MQHVLVYDGDCNMCSAFIRFLVDRNTNPNVYITDFNSDWYQNSNLHTDVDSVMFYSNNQTYIYSDAIINALSKVHPMFKVVMVLKVIPKFIRDPFYRFIAKHRHRIFKKNYCALPSKKYQEMYLK